MNENILENTRRELLDYCRHNLKDFVRDLYAPSIRDERRRDAIANVHYLVWRAALDKSASAHRAFQTELTRLLQDARKTDSLPDNIMEWVDREILQELISISVMRNRNSPRNIISASYLVALCARSISNAPLARAA